MKALKNLSVAILLVLISILIPYYLEPDNPILVGMIFLIIGFSIFNLIARKSLSFKNYFTSRYNIFTSKVWAEKSFDISKELMFEKMVEVIKNSEFKIVDMDEENFEILAITSLTWSSWGENLYISFESDGENSKMKFCSSTLFQMYSWGKNEKNYTELMNRIENSFTI